jgi:hypothetical protein
MFYKWFFAVRLQTGLRRNATASVRRGDCADYRFSHESNVRRPVTSCRTFAKDAYDNVRPLREGNVVRAHNAECRVTCSVKRSAGKCKRIIWKSHQTTARSVCERCNSPHSMGPCRSLAVLSRPLSPLYRTMFSFDPALKPFLHRSKTISANR